MKQYRGGRPGSTHSVVGPIKLTRRTRRERISAGAIATMLALALVPSSALAQDGTGATDPAAQSQEATAPEGTAPTTEPVAEPAPHSVDQAPPPAVDQAPPAAEPAPPAAEPAKQEPPARKAEASRYPRILIRPTRMELSASTRSRQRPKKLREIRLRSHSIANFQMILKARNFALGLFNVVGLRAMVKSGLILSRFL